MVGQQRFDRVAQERREMPRERRDDEDFRPARLHILAEMQQRAEWRFQRRFFDDGDVLIARLDPRDPISGPLMRELEAADQFQRGGHAPPHRMLGLAVDPA